MCRGLLLSFADEFSANLYESITVVLGSLRLATGRSVTAVLVVASHTLTGHSMSLSDLLSRHFRGYDAPILGSNFIPFGTADIKPKVRNYIVLENAAFV